MKLYKWYKGDELPDRESDCVFCYVDDKGDFCYETGRFYLEETGLVLRDNRDDYEILLDKIIAWLPIKFPEEVE